MKCNMSDPSWINEGRKEGDPYRCEEASMFTPSTPQFHAPCAAPAANKMWSERGGRHYWMCDGCADHNLRRGMVKMEEA